MAACLTENDLLDLTEGRLSPELAADYEAHLDTCDVCQELLAAWLRDDGDRAGDGEAGGTGAALEKTVDERPHLTRSQRQEEILPRGTRVGRYVVLRRIGMGAMGLVYAARDPELDRTVALKVLRVEVSGAIDSEARTRLLREAQAMARINHPNVAAVHDVGTIGKQVFLAMEYLDGGTLLDWQMAHPERPWREILRVYLQAGRGLAAAHAQGLVHRDFKPENVVLGRDNRVRVTDFGLARPLRLELDAHGVIQEGQAGMGPLDLSMTPMGALIGTPAYMALEAILGERADARSDQFSFCVALYEALYGARPFEADDLQTTAAKIRAGLPQASEAQRVPPWIRRVLARGLAAGRQDRYPDMEALLAALERAPARRWRRVAMVSALVMPALLTGGLFLGSRAQMCRGSERALGGAWDAARKEQARAAFLATGKSFAQGAWRQVEQRLDKYAADWSAMRTEACEATRFRGEQSEQVLALRMGCLDGMRMELEARGRMFAHADEKVVTAAVRAASELPDLQRCADTERLLARIPPPADNSSRKHLDAVRASLADIGAMLAAGRYQEGEAQARSQVEKARSLGYPPLLAEALELHGRLQEKAGDPVAAVATLDEAERIAGLAGDEGLAGKISSQLAEIYLRRPELDPGKYWLHHGERLLRRIGRDDVLMARLLEQKSRVLRFDGDDDGAVETMQQALEMKERAYGPNHMEIADSLNLLARLIVAPDRRPQALEFARRALRITEVALGPNHPDVAEAWMTVGQVYRDAEHFQEEFECAEKALAIRESALGSDHIAVAPVRQTMGVALQNLGNAEGALKHFRIALALFERTYGADGIEAAAIRCNIAIVQAEIGEDEEALAGWQRALPAYENAYGPDSHRNIFLLQGIALAMARRHRFAEADTYLKRAFAGARSASPEDPDKLLVYTYTDQAEILRLQGRISDARATQERAIKLLRRDISGPSEVVAQEQVNLARLLSAETRPEQAMAIVRPARKMLEAELGPGHRLLAGALAVEGEVARTLGDTPHAVELLERAVQLYDQWQFRPELEAESRFALARALGLGGPHRVRARALAISARDDFDRSGDRQRVMAVRAWIVQGE